MNGLDAAIGWLGTRPEIVIALAALLVVGLILAERARASR